ncbi:MAG: hypothetical protein PHE83_18065 [Opitutaceae bacterium]|nr:hypothetical protein [Opitutaceae bacterium]
MQPLYFKVFPLGRPMDELKAKLGDFNASSLDEEVRNDPDAIAKARREYEAKLRKRSYSDPAYGMIGAIAYRQPDGTLTVDTHAEKSLLEDFWQHYRHFAGDIAGWNIFDADLHWLLVRSWANRVPVPAAATRRAGTGRRAWVGFTDLKRELAGGPSQALDLDQVCKAFGWEGVKTTDPASAVVTMREPEPTAAKALALANIEDDLRQLHDLGVRMGIERADFEKIPPVRSAGSAAASLDGPTTLDIETAPGDPGVLKKLCGEFDPAQVKTGHARKPETIQAIIDRARAKYDQDLIKASLLNPFLGRVCAIGYRSAGGTIDIPEYDERALLEDFWSRAERGERFNGWNLFKFDLQFLYVRSLLLNVRVPANFRSRAGTGYVRYRGVTDLMWEFTGSPREYASVQTACDAFGLKGKNGDGANFHKLWLSGDPQLKAEGRNYLANDVTQEAALAEVMGFAHPQIEVPNLPAERLDVVERRMLEPEPACPEFD